MEGQLPFSSTQPFVYQIESLFLLSTRLTIPAAVSHARACTHPTVPAAMLQARVRARPTGPAAVLQARACTRPTVPAAVLQARPRTRPTIPIRDTRHTRTRAWDPYRLRPPP